MCLWWFRFLRLQLLRVIKPGKDFYLRQSSRAVVGNLRHGVFFFALDKKVVPRRPPCGLLEEPAEGPIEWHAWVVFITPRKYFHVADYCTSMESTLDETLDGLYLDEYHNRLRSSRSRGRRLNGLIEQATERKVDWQKPKKTPQKGCISATRGRSRWGHTRRAYYELLVIYWPMIVLYYLQKELYKLIKKPHMYVDNRKKTIISASYFGV